MWEGRYGKRVRQNFGKILILEERGSLEKKSKLARKIWDELLNKTVFYLNFTLRVFGVRFVGSGGSSVMVVGGKV